MSALSAVTCPVCGAPFNKLENNCPYCGVLVVIKSDHHRINASQLNRTVINERIHEYRQALKKDREDATARYGLGVAYFNLGLLEESISELSEAAQLMPENPHIQAQLGVVLNEFGRLRGPEYTERAWKRLERALMLEPDNEDALVLREDLLRQRLRSPNTSPSEQAIARRQLLQTWRTLAHVDEDRARPLIAQFLTQNESVLRALPGWKGSAPRIHSSREKSAGWFWKTLGRAALSMVILFFVFGLFSEILPEEDGQPANSFAEAILAILALSIFIVPIIVFIRGNRQHKRTPRENPSAARTEPVDPRTKLFDGTAAMHLLLEAASSILETADSAKSGTGYSATQQ